MIDDNYLLPGSQFESAVSDGQGNGRSKQGGLDMAVAVTVMPGLFVSVIHIRRCQPVNGLFKILDDSWFIFNSRDRSCRSD